MNSTPLTSRIGRALAIAALLFLVAGCSAVYVSRPVGDRPHALKAEEWDGLWLGIESDSLTVMVTDAENGQLQFAEIERKEGQMTLKRSTAFIRESGDWLFASLRDNDEGAERFAWVRIKRDGNVVVVWIPDIEKFRALIRSGALKGTAEEKGDVTLEPLSAVNLKAITSGDLGMVFDWETPIVLRRAGK